MTGERTPAAARFPCHVEARPVRGRTAAAGPSASQACRALRSSSAVRLRSCAATTIPELVFLQLFVPIAPNADCASIVYLYTMATMARFTGVRLTSRFVLMLACLLGLTAVPLVPARAQGAPRLSKPVDSTLVIPAGSIVITRLERGLSLSSLQPGVAIPLMVDSAVRVDGRALIPAESFIMGTLTSVPARASAGAEVELGIRFHEVVDRKAQIADVFVADVPNDSAYRRGVTATARTTRAPGDSSIIARGSLVRIVVASAFSVVTHRLLTSPYGVATRLVGSPSRLECYVTRAVPTPDIVIPGTASVPAIGDAPAIPGTPDIVVPGPLTTTKGWVQCQ